MPLRDLLRCAILLEGGPGLRKAELIRQMLTVLSNGHVPVDALPELLRTLLRREEIGSTAIGGGVALPHAVYPAIDRAVGVLGLARRPVWFDSLDGEPVDLILLMLAPSIPPGTHLGMVMREASDLWRALRDDDFLAALRRAATAAELHATVAAYPF